MFSILTYNHHLVLFDIICTNKECFMLLEQLSIIKIINFFIFVL